MQYSLLHKQILIPFYQINRFTFFRYKIENFRRQKAAQDFRSIC